jgi:hypothetical protein
MRKVTLSAVFEELVFPEGSELYLKPVSGTWSQTCL